MKQLCCIAMLSVSLLCMYCGKGTTYPPSPLVDTLPAVTAEGKNTVGSLVNGKVFIPRGSVGPANPSAYYDPNAQGGSFNLTMTRFDPGDSIQRSFQVIVTNLDKTGAYPITTPMKDVAFIYMRRRISSGTVCEYIGMDAEHVKQEGQLVITKLDTGQKIVAGTFTCTLITAGCDTVRMTEGRFDMKY
ncbi:hypothetical protein [Chitinophaga sp. OAE865]|uniref:hypothetical protein n=1 Tax=Chitinophaga sp. OAE865 TaxID=2817898 RepID=UPI001AE1E417